jgi:hypothetical protein
MSIKNAVEKARNGVVHNEVTYDTGIVLSDAVYSSSSQCRDQQRLDSPDPQGSRLHISIYNVTSQYYF